MINKRKGNQCFESEFCEIMRIFFALLSLAWSKLSTVDRNDETSEGIGRMGWHFTAKVGTQNIVTSLGLKVYYFEDRTFSFFKKIYRVAISC